MDEKEILKTINNLNKPRRKVLSSKFPFLKPLIIFIRIFLRKIKNRLKYNIARTKSSEFIPHIIARHQSVLIRKLGNSDIKLQQSKIINLKQACQILNGLVIEPGQTFSFWEIIEKPTHQKGYVEGMLLSQGKVIPGVGGGLCQLSNFLCWIFLHTDIQIIERHHHSFDVFPDSGRILPFGSGATCLYNFVDLKIKNISNATLQIKIWLTDTHLKGQILSDQKAKYKYSIQEDWHFFVKYLGKYYRLNELSRIKFQNGQVVKRKKIFTNFAPVLYEIPLDYFQKNNFKLIDFDSKN